MTEQLISIIEPGGFENVDTIKISFLTPGASSSSLFFGDLYIRACNEITGNYKIVSSTNFISFVEVILVQCFYLFNIVRAMNVGHIAVE